VRVGLNSISKTPNYHLANNCVVSGIDYVRSPGLPLTKLPRTYGELGRSVYLPMYPRRKDLLHLWNSVRIQGSGPWGVTFESRFPRVPDNRAGLAANLLNRVASDASCRFINAMSEYAKRRFVSAALQAGHPELASRVEVVYPSVKLSGAQREIEQVREDEALKVVFVGRDFFRKGGEAVLSLIEHYGRELNVSATIVSDVGGPDYATKWVGTDYAREVRRRLSDNANIDWLGSASRSEIAKLLGEAHIGVLPTLADTFGYSLVESMRMGAAVIGSSVQAMPEIVGSNGWSISLPTDPNGEWSGIGEGKPAYDAAMALLTKGMAEAIREARLEPEKLRETRLRARAHAEERYGDPRDRQLRDIYLRSAS
jgi:glycosyltransferase involved in cell wall biosynthesis